jgi:mannose-6-phosphate isomerase-like protein (cupin superfamily)
MQIVKEVEQEAKGPVKYMIRGPNIDWGVITLAPGESMTPHFHQEVEETFYIIEGTTTIVVKDKNKEIEAPAGTAIRLEPTEQHGLKNAGKIPTKMVFIKHIYRPKDKVDC